MKKTLIIIFFFNSLIGITQDKNFGVIISINNCTHTNFNPAIPEDGQTQWNNLFTNGIGFFYNLTFTNKIGLTLECAYNKRGYTEEAQTGFIYEPINLNTLQNSLSYASIVNSISYPIFSKNWIKIFPKIGLEFNYLLARNLESEKIEIISRYYPVAEYQNNWKKLNLNSSLGLNFLIDGKIALEPSFNRSITPLLKTENLIIKDWIWSLKAYFHLNKIFNFQK